MKMKRWSLMLLTLVIAAVTGCSGVKEASSPTTGSEPAAKETGVELGANGPVEIDFWHIQATIYGDAIKEIVAEFNKEYEGKVVVKEVFQGSYDDLNKKIRAALQGGGLPAVAMAYESDTLEYMKADKIVALDSFIEDPKYGLSKAELNDIMPGVLARQRIAAYNGKTMSWPHGNSSLGAYYNAELLQKAGYDKPAKTWKEFEKQAIDIYEKTGVPALVLGNGTGYGTYGGSFRTWLRTYGIESIKEDLSGVDLDNKEAVELATILKNLVDKKAIVLAQDTEQEFTNGRAAMEFGTTARTSTKLDLIKDKFKWGITLIPQGGAKEPVTELYGGNQVLFKTTPEKELAGWLFLKYFAGPKAQAIYAEKTGYFPATKSSIETELLKKDYTTNVQKQQAFAEVFPHATISVPTAASRVVNDAVNVAVQSVFAGKATPEDAFKKAQADASKAFAQYK
ncbi:extracellular solute-binding protein [Paenibacillus turpanensis]|uniref:extracellular solute-binding protein n=1 Tax=Paenibacillus turpanensis TaxID=2689078 RepID=UPI001409FA84|nr:extracellular solute-binding protein [Paenibacillus turpanensis]